MKTFREYIFESETQDLEKKKAELQVRANKADVDDKQKILMQITSLDDKLRMLANR